MTCRRRPEGGAGPERAFGRRRFLAHGALWGAALAAAGPRPRAAEAGPRAAGAREGPGDLRITRLTFQAAPGRRATPVAPNAYAPYRGFEVREPLLRIRTAQGIEGVGRFSGKPETLKGLLGLDASRLFDWDGDAVRGPAAAHPGLREAILASDVALLDLLGRALRRPLAALLGKELREAVPVYDSSLYMEDLLRPAERAGLAYLKEPPPDDPAEMVARKALWVLSKPGGIRILKIKIGRAKWMASFEEALERDLQVVRAVRKAAGGEVKLLVDGNDGYGRRPLAAAELAVAAGPLRLHALEEMFSEEKVEELLEVKRRIRAAGLPTRLADGENFAEGLPAALLARRLLGPSGGDEPLFDINQPDMNQAGLLRMREIAGRSAAAGLTLAPHNFGSKMGFYSQVHLGRCVPSWEFSEVDDSEFPGLLAPGVAVREGRAGLTGEPGLGVSLLEDRLERPSMVLDA